MDVTAIIKYFDLNEGHQSLANLYSIIGSDLNSGDVVIFQKYRTQGVYIIGTTGTGKSTLIANLINRKSDFDGYQTGFRPD